MTFSENTYKKESLFKLLFRLIILLNIFTFVGNGSIYAKTFNLRIDTEIVFKLNSKVTKEVALFKNKLSLTAKKQSCYFSSICWKTTLLAYEKLIKESLDNRHNSYFSNYKSQFFSIIKNISQNSDEYSFISISG
jgi:hypothetical protein